MVAEMMKGVLLCGGQGTRLRPMTDVINKHLIRVLDLPMAEYPLRQMIACGIEDIFIVTGGENFAGVVKYFGSGSKWDVRITYAIQDRPGGIAQALGMAEQFAGKDKVLVCLGDNIWSSGIREQVTKFAGAPADWAALWTIESDDPRRFGVVQFDKNGIAPVDVVEKPKDPPSSWILPGIYAYGHRVFEVIKTLTPSDRGELEISDVNRHYIKAGRARIFKMSGWWSDCGTMDSLLQTERLLRNDK